MTVQDIYVVITIWGKGVFDLKLKTTRKKKIPVTEDLSQVPKELVNLHNDIVMTAEIFFINKIPLFLTLRRKIDLSWYTIFQTGISRKSTTPSMRCTYNIENGDL